MFQDKRKRSLCEFFLFSRVKNTWKGKRLDDVEITKQYPQEQWNKVVRVEEAYMLVNRVFDFHRLTLDMFL